MHFVPPLVCAIALAFVHVPQDPSPAVQAGTERFAQAMKATGLSFEKSSTGKSYLVNYDDDGARRTVFVSLRPEEPGGLLTHTIYTSVWTGPQAPDAARLRQVFSSSKKFGGFYTYMDSKGTWAIRFGVSFDATDLGAGVGANDPLVKRLREMIGFVEAVGAETAKELSK